MSEHSKINFSQVPVVYIYNPSLRRQRLGGLLAFKASLGK
jgi:hypothetical protein